MRKNILVVLGICAVSGSLLVGCARSEYLTQPGEVTQLIESEERQDEGRSDDEAYEASLPDFSQGLFSKSLDQMNPILSPVSAYLALSLAGEGARGKTAEEFAFVLGDDRRDVAEGLMKNLPAQEEGLKVVLANSVWLDDELASNQDWEQIARDSYQAEVYRADLAEPSIVPAVNHWIDEQTNGLIPDFLNEPLGEDARLALFHTIYFKGTWTNPFQPYDTHDHAFKLEDGSEIQTSMMEKYAENVSYINEDVYDGIVLSYQHSSLKFIALKPTEGSSVREMYQGLDMGQIGSMVEEAQEENMDLWLPKFEVTFDRTLNNDLTDMGIKSAFIKGMADFSGLEENGGNESLYISLVRQKAVFLLNEEGTEAAAVTGEVFQAMSAMKQPPLEVHFDRPFLYMVYDTQTDAPLFIGIMDDPRAK